MHEFSYIPAGIGEGSSSSPVKSHLLRRYPLFFDEVGNEHFGPFRKNEEFEKVVGRHDEVAQLRVVLKERYGGHIRCRHAASGPWSSQQQHRNSGFGCFLTLVARLVVHSGAPRPNWPSMTPVSAAALVPPLRNGRSAAIVPRVANEPLDIFSLQQKQLFLGLRRFSDGRKLPIPSLIVADWRFTNFRRAKSRRTISPSFV